MSKSFKKFLSALLTILMIIACIPTNVYANEIKKNKIDEEAINNIISAQNDENSDNIVAEITENRTENSKTYLMDDGTYCDVISAKQIHESETNSLESVAPQLDQLPVTTDDAIERINEYAENTNNEISYASNQVENISQGDLFFYTCNQYVSLLSENGVKVNVADSQGEIDKGVFLLKGNVNNSYFSSNKIINKVTISFEVEGYKNSRQNTILYCYYGDDNYLSSNIEYGKLSEKHMIDLCNIQKGTTQISFNITEIYSKWDRNSIENQGMYFGSSSTVQYSLSNPTIIIDYSPCGYEDLNQTYHNIDLGTAGEILINDYTNTLTLKQNLAGIDLNLMGVELSKYLTSSNDGLNSTCGPNSTLNYNSYVKLYNNSLVWKMFDGSEKIFNRPADSVSDENGFEEWDEIEETRTGIHNAKLTISENTIEGEYLFADYSNTTIEYGNSIYTFDMNGYLSKIACGNTNIQLTFSNGTIIAISDGDGNLYSLIYGGFQHNNRNYTYLKKISVKDKNNTSIKFDGQNDYIVNCLYTINEDNTITYKTTYPNDETLEIIYDNSFNIISVKYNDIITTFEYKEGQKYLLGYTQMDDDSQIVSQVSIDSSNSFERVYTYISEDNKIEILDFNKLGKLISSIDKNGNQVCFDYDDFGNLRSCALAETTKNLISNGSFDNTSGWSNINNNVLITNGIAEIPSSISQEQGLRRSINNLYANKTYVLTISGQCENLVSSDNAFLGVELFGCDDDGEEHTIVLPLIKGNCPENQFEIKRKAFKLDYSLLDVEISIVSHKQDNEAKIDYVSLQEAEESSVTIDVGTPISAIFNENGLIERETIDDGTQKLVTQYTYDASNNVSEITDQNGIKTYYDYENGKMVSKGNIKDGNTIINPVKFSYNSIGLLESVEQLMTIDGSDISNFKTEYQYKYDQVSQITRNGITYMFSYYSNGDIKGITLKHPSDEEQSIKLIENDYSDETYNAIVKYANGYSAKIKQNNNRVSEINYTDNGNKTLFKYTYSYNDKGDLQTIYDNSKIKTCFSDNGFSVLYMFKGSSNENQNIFREIYKKTISTDGIVSETYFSDIVDDTGKPTEKNITYPIVVTNQDTDTVYTQKISTEKPHSSLIENTNIKCSTNIKSIRDYFGRLKENDIRLDPEYRNSANTEYTQFHMNANSSYVYQSLPSNADENITSNLVSQRNDRYVFGEDCNRIIHNNIYSYEYYPNGKIKLISFAYEGINESASNSETIASSPMIYYEYDSSGNISFEFNLQLNICCEYLYNSYGSLSKRTYYWVDHYDDNTLEPIFYNYLLSKQVLTSTDFEGYDSKFNIESMETSEKVIIDLNCNDLNAISSVNIDGEQYDIEVDELGQPLDYVNAFLEIEGKCEWTGNLLTGFETQDKRFEFTYDVNGYRASKISYSKRGEKWDYDNTVFYNWEEGILQGIYLINEKETSLIPAYTDIIYDINNSPVAIQTPTGLQYLFEKDASGNITALINLEGNIAASFKYDAFGNFSLKILGDNWGEELVNFITAWFNPCTYKGALFDYDIGMYFIQNRCYSPFFGRYLNISNYDSLNNITELPNTNPHMFCNNDPINYSDTVLNGLDNYSIKISQNGFTVDMSKAFLSKSYCSTFANSLLKRLGMLTSAGKYEFLGMDKERIQSDLFAHSLGRYCEESINRVNSVWGDGWLFSNRNSRSIYVNNRDIYYKKYEEIWNSAEAIRKYAVNKGIYIGL